MEPIRFTYVGPAAFAAELAKELRTRSFSVDYEPPIEERDLTGSLTIVELPFTVLGSISGIILVVHAVMRRFSGRARVEGLPDDGRRSVHERLADLDELNTSGTITKEEYDRERARILGEL